MFGIKNPFMRFDDTRHQERNRHFQELRNEQIKQDLSSSQREFEERILGGTCLEHYGYLTNQFSSMSDEDLEACMRSYFAMRRGIGPNNPILVEKIELYIEKWEEFLSIADPESSKTDRYLHAIKACYIDLNIEAASRFAIKVMQDKGETTV